MTLEEATAVALQGGGPVMWPFWAECRCSGKNDKPAWPGTCGLVAIRDHRQDDWEDLSATGPSHSDNVHDAERHIAKAVELNLAYWARQEATAQQD